MKVKNIFFLALLSASPLLAWDNVWWNEPGPIVEYQESASTSDVPATGIQKALVIVASFPEDTALYYPLLYDSLIADSIQLIDSSLYRWSISNFLYAGSWGQLQITGKVNPGKNGRYLSAPRPLAYYKRFGFSLKTGYTARVDSLERDLIRELDPYVDYNDFDADQDGYVDFIFFIHPLNPHCGFYNDELGKPDSSNYGLAFSPKWTEVTGDSSLYKHGECVKVSRCTRFGSTMSYYHPDTTKRIDRAAASNLACHELGHCFGCGLSTRLAQSDYALPDRYEDAGNSNYHAVSCGVGKYTVMQLGYYTIHPQLYEPWERMHLGWITPTVINENSQNVSLYNFNGTTNPRLYMIPVDTVIVDSSVLGSENPPRDTFVEYFLLANYQPDDHWFNDLGRTWKDELDDGPASGANGLLVWHVHEQLWQSEFQPSELMKFEDLECAEGLKDLSGSQPSPFGTEAGWDRLDRWAMWSWEGRTQGWARDHNASTSDYRDFFNPSYKTAFHTLTNPTSDACNMRIGGTYGLNYTYPDTASGGGQEYTEQMRLQNLPTHVSLEGIHYDSPGVIKLCIRRSRIWTDEEMAMDRTTQRKLICDSEDTFHFVYPLKGHIYYTKTYDPSKIWFTAELIGPNPIEYDSIGYGIWPALTLDENREPLAVYFDTSCSKVLYGRKLILHGWYPGQNPQRERIDTVWKTPDTLKLSGTPGPVAIEYGCGSNTVVNPGGTTTQKIMTAGTEGSVHLAYITSDNGQDKLGYAHYYKTDPTNLAEEILDTAFTEGARILGASIEVDSQYNRVYIAYGCVKGDTAACYYLTKTDTGWIGPYKFTSSKSDTANEPLVPFLNIEGNYVTAVFNANDNVYATTKLRSNDYGFTGTSQISNISGRNRYPQVGGNTVTWTCYVTDDSSNVYKRTLPSGTTTRFDAAYEGKSYFAQVAKTASGSAQLYQHGVFSGPKWAIYNGSGGNQENEGKPVPFTPPEGFKMAIPNNILVGSRLSIFTTGGDCRILVYDITGRQIACQDIKDVSKLARIETPLDCKGWAKGVYFVRAVPKDGKVATSKVVLVR